MKIPSAKNPPHALRVFVVENHRDTLEYMQMYLESLGHEVSTAGTMEAALGTLPGAGCDVLISDIGLPDGTGWELLHRAGLPPSVYCIAMSGFGMGVDHLKSQEAGYRHHLLKPFNPAELDRMLEDAAREKFAGTPATSAKPS